MSNKSKQSSTLQLKKLKMESRNWKSKENKLFCEILVNPANNFMVTLKRKVLKKKPQRERYSSPSWLKCRQQKQPSRGVPRKRSYENVQQIYRRTTMTKCDVTPIVVLKMYAPTLAIHHSTLNTTLKMTTKNTAQKMKFYIKDFFSKCDQIRRKLRI